MKYVTRQKEKEKEKAEDDPLLRPHARKNSEAQVREVQRPNPRRRKGQIHKLQKGRTSETAPKRSRTRIQADRCAGTRCNAETGYGIVLKTWWTPNPGSFSACASGCSCPLIDNNFGSGYLRKPTLFVIHSECQIHGLKPLKNKFDINPAKG